MVLLAQMINNILESKLSADDTFQIKQGDWHQLKHSSDDPHNILESKLSADTFQIKQGDWHQLITPQINRVILLRSNTANLQVKMI